MYCTTMLDANTLIRGIKISGLFITLILLIIGLFVPGWRIRELPTATMSTNERATCPRFGLWIAEICYNSDQCNYAFIPALQTDMLTEERPAQWVPHQILGTIGVCASLVASVITVGLAFANQQSSRTSTADLVVYTCACISALFTLIPMAVVLEENNDLQKTVKLKTPYSLLIFGLGGILMCFIVFISCIDIVRKSFPIQELALTYMAQNRQEGQAQSTNANGETQEGTNTENTAARGSGLKLNIKMVLVLFGLFGVTFCMIFSLATPSWLDYNGVNCSIKTSFGLFYNDICDACADKPECRDTIVFSVDIKVQSLLALVLNVAALASVFFNRKTVRRAYRACAALIFYTAELWSALLTVNVVGHVLAMPKDVLEHKVGFSYSLYVYIVASVIAVVTCAATGVFLIRNCSSENNVPINYNAESNAVGAEDNRNAHLRMSDIALVSSQREPEAESAVRSINPPLELTAPPLIPSAPPADEIY